MVRKWHNRLSLAKIMRGYICLFNMLLLCMVPFFAHAQTMQGQIMDVNGDVKMEDVQILNVHTQQIVMSDDDGRFSLQVAKGQLVEFSKEGYKVLRVRIPMGNMPAYFKVAMERVRPMPSDNLLAGTPEEQYKADSAKYYNMYKRELEFPELTGLDVIRHPFSAMSKRNQEIWAFQKEYEFYQKQKYIDFIFNDRTITQLTGLSGDSLQVYKQMFRPTYEQLRAMGEYAYYNYIKRSVKAYRDRGIRAKSPPSRGAR